MTEALGIRSVLAYALGGAVVGLCAYLSLVPFDSDAMRFATIDHRQLEVMTGAGILAGLVYWIIAGRSAGALAHAIVLRLFLCRPAQRLFEAVIAPE